MRSAGIQMKEFLLVSGGALFAVTGIITGIQPEVTRAVGAARRDGVYRVRVVYVAGAFGLLAGLLVVLTSPLWAHDQIPTNTPWAVGSIAAATSTTFGPTAQGATIVEHNPLRPISWADWG